MLGLKLNFPGQIYIAIFLVIFGVVVGLVAIRRFYQIDTTVLPQEMDSSSTLVTGGILKISRNPMYLGMAAVIAGGQPSTSDVKGRTQKGPLLL